MRTPRTIDPQPITQAIRNGKITAEDLTESIDKVVRKPRNLSRTELLTLSECVLCKMQQLDIAYSTVLREGTRDAIRRERTDLIKLNQLLCDMAEE